MVRGLGLRLIVASSSSLLSQCVWSALSIPPSLFDLPAIEIVYMGNNTLTGTIPPTYSTPSGLRELWLDGNLLTGTVPAPTAGQLVALEELILNRNLLTGEVPAGVCALRDDRGGELVSLHADCAQPPTPPQIGCACCTKCTASAGAR